MIIRQRKILYQQYTVNIPELGYPVSSRYPNSLVRHEGANYQRVKVPSGKLSVHPGNYPGIEAGRFPW